MTKSLKRRRQKINLAHDTMTVLVTANGYRATKRFTKRGREVEKEDYDAGYLFSVMSPWNITNINELSEVLTSLETIPNAFVIRGLPRSSLDVSNQVQRLNDNFEAPATGHHWIMIDLDKIIVPKQLSLKKNKALVIEHLVKMLPAEFHNASYHWQISSSAGIGPAGKVSMHLWYWLDKPMSDDDLKAWAKCFNLARGMKLIDPALFQAVQVHYTAAPLFVGMADPFPVRSGLTIKPCGSVPLVMLKESPASPPKKNTAKSTKSAISSRVLNASKSHGFENILEQIGDHAGGDGFHEPIIRAAASYVATHGKDGTDEDDLFEIISARILTADASHHDLNYINHMASRDHIVPAIEGALKKFGDQAASSPRLHKDVEPHFTSAPQPVMKAKQRLEKIFKNGF